jgi:hypothetical protein
MMLNYLIEMFIFQALFLGFYQLIKSEPFFRANRVYLLATLVISLLLPIVEFSQSLPVQLPQAYIEWLSPIQIGEQTSNTLTVDEIENLDRPDFFNWNIYHIVYLSGLGFYLVWFILRNRSIFHYLSLNSFEDYKFVPVVLIPQTSMAFSFLDRIYLGSDIPESQQNVILEHEYQHLRQKHSWDMLFAEMLQILFWFNPLIYIYKNQIRQIHEFEADRSVTASHSKVNYINTLLNQSFGSQNVSFVNSFFNSTHLKNRIKMLQHTRSSTLKKLKYLLVIPVLFMAFLISCSQEELIEPEMTEEERREEMNLFFDRIRNDEPDIFKVISTKPNLERTFDYYDLKIKDNYSEVEKDKAGIILFMITINDKFESNLNYRDQILNDIQESKSLMNLYDTLQKIRKKANKAGFDASNFGETSSIPFALIDKPPHPSFCDGLTGVELKKCVSEFISTHVNQNFDTTKFSDLELGRYRVSVQFKIDKTGKVSHVRARGATRALEEEASEIMLSLPQMTPGEVDGEPVNVLYGLPINFVIGE